MKRTYRFVAALVLVLAAARPAAADTLEEAVRAAVKEIQDLLKGQEQSLTLASIIPHPRSHVALHSGAGAGIRQKLLEELQRAKIEVKRISNVTLSGTFREAEDRTGRQMVELELKCYDRARDSEHELAHRFVKSETAIGHLLGVPFQPRPGATPKERADELKRKIDQLSRVGGAQPLPELAGDRIRAQKGSKFALQIEVARPRAASAPAVYAPRRPTADGGMAFVKIDRNEVYAIRLFNDADFDVAVDLCIDGLSLFVACDRTGPDPKTGQSVPLRDSKTNQPLLRYVIVPRGKSVLVRGWFINLKRSDEFQVTDYAKSLAGQLKSDGSVGMATACFHAVVKKGEKLPPGEPAENTHAAGAHATGRGAPLDQEMQVVERTVGGLRAVVGVRYDR